MVVLCKRTAGTFVGICILIMVLVVRVSAQKNLSLANLVDSASRHLPTLLEKQALVNGAKAGITDAKHAFVPKLNVVEELTVSTDNDLAGGYLPFGGILRGVSGGINAANNYQPQTGNLASFYGEYELVNFGLRGAKVDNAQAYVGVKQADLEKEVYLVKLQVAKTYFDIIKNTFQLGVDERNIERYNSMYNITTALTSTGVNAGVDSSLAKAELSKARIGLYQRAGILNQLKQQLQYLTGVPWQQIEIDTTEKRWESYLQNLSSHFSDTVNNPLLDYFLVQKQWNASNETLISKSYLPKIMVGAGGWARGSSIQYNNDYKSVVEGLGYQRLNYTAGIGITYDLSSGLHKKDRLAVAHFSTVAADEAAKQTKLSLDNESLQADEAIKTANKTLAELPVQLDAAENAYEQKIAQYQAGIINLVDLTNATFVLYQAQTNYIGMLNEWYLANLEKAAVTGNLDLFIQTVK
jgi:outer membrane protein TolC